jgi:predicted transcriptional regulator
MDFDSNHAIQLQPVALGPLESEIILVISEHQDASVQEVRDRLSRPLAYTTVMTTLDRLYKKSLLERRKSGRGFLYKFSQYLSSAHLRPAEHRSLATVGLISYFVDAVSTYDENMLDALEKKIAERRQQFAQKEGR